MQRHKLVLALSLLAAGTLAFGCSNTKRIESTEVPKAAPTAVPVKAVASDHYTVALRDTLWGIAGKSDIYNDNFQWPLIFKANRDTIKDPDLIYPKQDFMIQKGLSDEEVSHAKDLAMRTPKFVPHSKPRDTLPLDYF
jgi:LysM repeat protein